RRYVAQLVPRALLEQLLEAACRAPSPHNRQPWRFVVLVGQPIRARLAHAMADQLRRDLARDGLPAERIEQDAQRSIHRITSAGAAILVCMTLRDMDVYPDEQRNAAERWMAGQAVAAAIQNLLLRATELGLGACWMCAPLFCPDVVRAVLSLPEDWLPQALITLGYPADDGRDRPRLPLSEVSLWMD
ncbi:MAG: nitroreductase family protein, partial [Anaerolineae bacterium]|nr:nitroreductase family protein [Thermoflexales bacterium]MDW8409034.1 nitroreductase family protein [Anaerolineae bacterium]